MEESQIQNVILQKPSDHCVEQRLNGHHDFNIEMVLQRTEVVLKHAQVTYFS